MIDLNSPREGEGGVSEAPSTIALTGEQLEIVRELVADRLAVVDEKIWVRGAQQKPLYAERAQLSALKQHLAGTT